MSFQWLQLRIGEEQHRRQREEEIHQRLPLALQELHGNLAICVESYAAVFGPESAVIELSTSRIRVIVREQREGQWHPISTVDIVSVPDIPGFEVERAGVRLVIEVGVLPGEKLYFRDRETDQYVNEEELTRRILDRALFPRLKE